MLIAPTGIPATLCQGSTFNINNNLSAGTGCSFNSGNNFNVQLSDAAGSFGSPLVIGTATNTTAGGTISVNIPFPTATGAGYRIRVVGTNPVVIGPDNGSNLSVSDFGIDAPTFVGITFCPGQSLTVNYTLLNSCAFPNTPSNNIFSAQLSDSFGSFASATTIGTSTASSAGTISSIIPVSTIAGNGYRIRVISSNPSPGGRTSPDNGTNLTVNAINLSAPTFVGTTFCPGSNFNVSYTFVSSCTFLTGNTFTAQLSNASGSFASPTNIGTSTVTTAGNISVTIPTTTPAGAGYRIRITGSNPSVNSPYNGANITISAYGINAPNIVQCSAPTTPGTLTVSSSLALSYAWTPTTGLTPSSGVGASVVAAPPSTTTYSVTGTDASTGCTVTGTTTVTVSNATPTLTTTNSIPTICSGVNTSVLTVSGASNYSWAPAGGLSSTTGGTVTANPSSSTSYTVTGNNGCAGAANTSSANLTVNVQTVPTTPPETGASSFGNNTWNVFSHYNNNTFSNLYGYYTEDNLSFNTTTRWANNARPSVANAASGLAYSGCSFTAPAVSTIY